MAKLTEIWRVMPSADAATRELVLYAADTPNSRKVASLPEELLVEYGIVVIDIMKGESKAPAYVRYAPTGGVTSSHVRRCCRNRGGLLRKQKA